jgi:hypothetical protein
MRQPCVNPAPCRHPWLSHPAVVCHAGDDDEIWQSIAAEWAEGDRQWARVWQMLRHGYAKLKDA